MAVVADVDILVVIFAVAGWLAVMGGCGGGGQRWVGLGSVKAERL